MSKKYPHFENQLVKHLKLCSPAAATLLMGGKGNNCLGFPAMSLPFCWPTKSKMPMSPGGKHMPITRSSSDCRPGEHCEYITAWPVIEDLVQENVFFPRKLFRSYNSILMTENHRSLRQKENSSVPSVKVVLFERQRCHSKDFNAKMCYSSYPTSYMTNITL